jgi:cell division transport system ATP-binding protein
MSEPNIVTLNNVSYTYSSGITALSHVTLAIPAGSCVLVTGHSGAGKTTLLKLIRGELSPTEGDVSIHGFSLSGFSRDDMTLLKQSTGYIEQDTQFLGSMTVYENLTFFAELNDFPVPDIDRLLDRVNLGYARNHHPSELSRGQRQILQTLRAIMHKPFLLIADEPIAHLDEVFVAAMVTLFRELQNAGTTLIIATHRTDPFHQFPKKGSIIVDKGTITHQLHIVQ